MGDVLQIRKDQKIPADCLLLYGETAQRGPVNTVFVETMQLDGETTLKSRVVIDSGVQSISDLDKMSARLEYDKPNKNLSQWNGSYQAEG